MGPRCVYNVFSTFCVPYLAIQADTEKPPMLPKIGVFSLKFQAHLHILRNRGQMPAQEGQGGRGQEVRHNCSGNRNFEDQAVLHKYCMRPYRPENGLDHKGRCCGSYFRQNYHSLLGRGHRSRLFHA